MNVKVTSTNVNKFLKIIKNIFIVKFKNENAEKDHLPSILCIMYYEKNVI